MNSKWNLLFDIYNLISKWSYPSLIRIFFNHIKVQLKEENLLIYSVCLYIYIYIYIILYFDKDLKSSMDWSNNFWKKGNKKFLWEKKKKKTTNVLTVFFIFHKSNVKTFLKWMTLKRIALTLERIGCFWCGKSTIAEIKADKLCLLCA